MSQKMQDETVSKRK